MKKILIAVLTAAFATSVYAACTTHTYTINGKMVTCQTCCYGTGSARTCNTTCF